MGWGIMTPAERKRHIRTIIHQNADALRAFREASTAFDKAVEGLGMTLAAVHTANQAQIEAINAIVAANDAALALFNDAD
jgi:hypothetical protein